MGDLQNFCWPTAEEINFGWKIYSLMNCNGYFQRSFSFITTSERGILETKDLILLNQIKRNLCINFSRVWIGAFKSRYAFKSHHFLHTGDMAE